MKDIALPVLPHDTPLRAVIAVMHQAGRSGVVTKTGGSVRLVRAGDVLKAIARGSGTTIGDLVGVEIATGATAPAHTTRSGGYEWSVTEGAPPPGVPMAPSSSPSYSRFGPVFGATGSDYALDSLSVGVAVVITRSEDYEADLQGGPVDCYCDGPRQHGYARPHPPICPRDTMPVNCWS